MTAGQNNRTRVATGVAAVAMAICTIAMMPGCSTMKPGDVATVEPISQSPRVGNVYLFRGIVGIFSTGLDRLGVEINDAGVHADVFQDDQWQQLADMLVKRYQNCPNAEPLVLVGHSWGADHIIAIAQRLDAAHVPVTLMLTLDPVTPPPLPPNVQRCENIYESNGIFDALPFFRGIPLKTGGDSSTVLINYNLHDSAFQKAHPDMDAPDVNHFSIEKSQTVHAEVISQILAACPPRSQWAAARRRPQPLLVRTSATRPAKAIEMARN